MLCVQFKTKDVLRLVNIEHHWHLCLFVSWSVIQHERDNPGFLGPVFRHSQNQHLEKFDGIQYIRFTGSVGTVDDSHFQQSYPVLNFIRIFIRHKSICRWLKTDFLSWFNREKILNAELCYHNRWFYLLYGAKV